MGRAIAASSAPPPGRWPAQTARPTRSRRRSGVTGLQLDSSSRSVYGARRHVYGPPGLVLSFQPGQRTSLSTGFAAFPTRSSRSPRSLRNHQRCGYNSRQVTRIYADPLIDTDRARSACRVPDISDKPVEVPPKRVVNPAFTMGSHSRTRAPAGECSGRRCRSGEIEDASSPDSAGCLHPRSRLTCPRSARLECVGTRRTRASVPPVPSVLERHAQPGVTVNRRFTATSFHSSG